MATSPIDYSALAKQAGAITNEPAKIDYSALAKQAGAISSEPAKAASLKSWSEKLGLGESGPGGPLAKNMVDMAEGAVSGAASTVFGAGDIVRRLTGQERILNKPAVQQSMHTPDTIAGKVGKFVEQGAEFAIPMTKVAKLGKTAELGLAAKTALEAGTSGVVSAVQSGGDPVSTTIGTIAGAAGPLIGSVGENVSGVLENAAAKQYARVLNATTKRNKFLSKTVAPGLLNRGISAFTMKGLQSKIGQSISKVGAAIGDAWDALPEGTKVKLDDVISTMDTTGAEAFTLKSGTGQSVPMGPLAQKGLENLKSLKDTLKIFAEMDPQTQKLMVPVDKLRNLRQYYDNIAAKAGRYQGQALADESVAEAHGMAADAIRDELAKQFPDIAVLNKEYHFWKDAQQVVKDTILRREGQAKPLGNKLMGAAGGAAGFATGGLHGLALGKMGAEGLETLVTSPAWRTVSANTKNKLANVLARGDRASAEFTIGNLVKTLGLESIISVRGNQSQDSDTQ
jgi:hypothetical protein